MSEREKRSERFERSERDRRGKRSGRSAVWSGLVWTRLVELVTQDEAGRDGGQGTG